MYERNGLLGPNDYNQTIKRVAAMTKKVNASSHYADGALAQNKDSRQCVVLVLNVPSNRFLDDFQKIILNAYRDNWVTKHRDSHLSRIHFVYVDPNKSQTDPCYLPLSLLGPGDEILVIGNHHPGKDFIFSDKVYLQTKNVLFFGQKQEQIAYEFSYQFLAGIITKNVNQDALRISEEQVARATDAVLYELEDPTQLPLTIKLLACSTGMKSGTGEISFAEKLFDALQEQQCNNVLVLGRLKDIVPVPLKNDPQLAKQFLKQAIAIMTKARFGIDIEADLARLKAFTQDPDHKGFHTENMGTFNGGHHFPTDTLVPFPARKGEAHKVAYAMQPSATEGAPELVPTEIYRIKN